MSKKVCQGCGDTLIGSNQEELDELLKIHWDYQNPSLKKCEYCNTIIHANDDELVKKKDFLNMKKFTEKQSDTVGSVFFNAKL